MKVPMLVAALCVGTAVSGSAEERRYKDSLERAFAAGGRVRLELCAGGYKISGSPDDQIHVLWSVRYPEELKRVRVDARVTGGDAAVEVSGGPKNDFRVELQIPARSDLVVRLTAGDLKIEGIQGHKDVESHAGDVEIEVGPVADLKHVEASVWAGDLQAAPLKISKGGLFRSFRWDGKGKYDVQAHLKAGDLRLR